MRHSSRSPRSSTRPIIAPPAQDKLPLFRTEALSAGSDPLSGPIRLAQPMAGWLVSLLALTIVAALLAFALLGSVTRKSRVSGIVVPAGGSATIASTNAGVLARSYVREGETVASGQPLFEISTERQGATGELSALIAHQLAARQASLESERWTRQDAHRKQMQALRERHDNLDAEAAKLEQETRLAQRRGELARLSVARHQQLRREGFVSEAQVQQKMEEWLDLAARLSGLERNRVQLEASRIALKSEVAATRAALANELAQLDRAQATLRQEVVENRNRRASLVIAPQAGVVSAIAHRPGQTVNAGQMLARLLPLDQATSGNGKTNGAAADTAPLEAHLYASSRTAGFVETGQAVLIRFDAYPYQKFGLHPGIVADVGHMPFAPAELPVHVATTLLGQAQQASGAPASSESLYRIRVRLPQQAINAYGRARPLKPGMTLEADVTQDRRRIWEWIAEPFLAVRRVAGEGRRSVPPPVQAGPHVKTSVDVDAPALSLSGATH